MITKDLIVSQLNQAVFEGRDPLNAIQKVFQVLMAEYPPEEMQEKTTLLNGILFFANDLFKPEQPYGYREFDLILSRTCPTSETLRFIEEQEGKNIFND